MASALRGTRLELGRIGLEACSLTAWLSEGLRAADLPAICIESRHAKAAMGAMPNKTDRNDARAIAQIMRTGGFREVHVKDPQCRAWRSLLVARRTVLNEMRSIENVVRHPAGGRAEARDPSRKEFVDCVRAFIADDKALARTLEPLLSILVTMLREFSKLTKQALDVVRREPVCRRLMSALGVGPLTALAYRATIDDPGRFKQSRAVGAHLGLTPRRYQSGETDLQGRVSRYGDELARTALYEAAHSLLTRSKKMVEPAGVGNADRQAARHGEGARRRCPQARDDFAPHVGRGDDIPLRPRSRRRHRRRERMRGAPTKGDRRREGYSSSA